MRSLRVRVIISLVLIALLGGVSALALYPSKMQRGGLKASNLPLTIASWVGREQIVDDYVKEILETEDVVERAYTSPLHGASEVSLAVVYSPDNRRVAHPPEVCYEGSNWEVSERRIVENEGLPAMVRLVIGHGSSRDLVLYCYKSGDAFIANYYQQQLEIIKNYLLLRPTASALVRFSTPIDASVTTAEQRLTDFARIMMPEIRKTLTDEAG